MSGLQMSPFQALAQIAYRPVITSTESGKCIREPDVFFKAEAVQRQALHIREIALGSNDLNVARSYNDLALELLKQQKFQDAADIFKRSLKDYE